SRPHRQPRPRGAAGDRSGRADPDRRAGAHRGAPAARRGPRVGRGPRDDARDHPRPMRVAVVGGGLSGLVAARHLVAADHRVTVLEAGPRLGGKVAAARLGDLMLDAGAESMLARVPEGQRPEVVELLTDLGCEIVGPEPAGAQLYVDGAVRPMPRSMVGVPFRAADLAEILTPEGLQRAEREPDLPAPPRTTDLAIGALVDERFGPEVTDRLLEPM